MITIIALVVLGVAFLATLFMAHQAHMRNKAVEGYFFGLIFFGFIFFMVAMIGSSGG